MDICKHRCVIRILDISKLIQCSYCNNAHKFLATNTTTTTTAAATTKNNFITYIYVWCIYLCAYNKRQYNALMDNEC